MNFRIFLIAVFSTILSQLGAIASAGPCVTQDILQQRFVEPLQMVEIEGWTFDRNERQIRSVYAHISYFLSNVAQCVVSTSSNRMQIAAAQRLYATNYGLLVLNNAIEEVELRSNRQQFNFGGGDLLSELIGIGKTVFNSLAAEDQAAHLKARYREELAISWPLIISDAKVALASQ